MSIKLTPLPFSQRTKLYTRLTCDMTQKLFGTLKNIFSHVLKFSQVILCLCSLSFFSCFVVEGSRVIFSPSFHPLLPTFPLHLLQNNTCPLTSPINIPVHIKLIQYEFPWFPQTLSHCSALLCTRIHTRCAWTGIVTHKFPHHYYFQLLTCYGNCQKVGWGEVTEGIFLDC